MGWSRSQGDYKGRLYNERTGCSRTIVGATLVVALASYSSGPEPAVES
jgi:hypothetical protein